MTRTTGSNWRTIRAIGRFPGILGLVPSFFFSDRREIISPLLEKPKNIVTPGSSVKNPFHSFYTRITGITPVSLEGLVITCNPPVSPVSSVWLEVKKLYSSCGAPVSYVHWTCALGTSRSSHFRVRISRNKFSLHIFLSFGQHHQNFSNQNYQ